MPQIGRLVNAIVKWKGRKVERALGEQLRDLKKSQHHFLMSVIRGNAETDFGREFKFSEVHSVEDYRKRVPILDYEKLRPYIEEQDKSNRPVLLRENPIFYAVTSGTTGKPKFIPVHKEALKAHKQSTNFFLYNFLKAAPQMFSGKILAIVSPAVEGYMEDSKRPYGSTSGQMYEGLSRFVKNLYVVPASVFAVEDYDLKYLTILRLALQERNISYLSTANPSTIAKLVNLLPLSLESMIDDIEAGTFREINRLDARSQTEVGERLAPSKARADELRRILQENPKPKICDLWPNLQAVGTWMGGSSSIFLDQLKGQFSESTVIRDLGYLSSEFRGSVPVLTGTNAGVPTFWNGYYEFVEQNEWDQGNQNFLGLDELQNGKNYYIFITTNYGLYRYNMNDIVQVDGFYQSAPMIRFMQKGKGVTSITGEKLYESQVIQTVSQLDAEMGVNSEFYLMVCHPEEARYTLYYELSPKIKDAALASEGIASFEKVKVFQRRMDEILGEVNIEYASKRKSGRLQPLRLVVLKRGSFEQFKKFYLGQGQREGQFKIVALQFLKDLKFNFAPYVGWDGALSEAENIEILARTRHSALLAVGENIPESSNREGEAPIFV